MLQGELYRDRRRPDGKLHPSGHLTGSIRHAQLDVAGAPKVNEDLVKQMALWIGSLIHEDINKKLQRQGIPYIPEMNITPWMPPGWGGRPDGWFWHPDYKAFVLADFKTTKGEGMRYILRDGAKKEHVFQTSMYWHAGKKMGLPLVKQIAVVYLPKNDTRSKDETIEPALIDFEPLSKKVIADTAKHRFARLVEYEDSLNFDAPSALIRAGRDPDDVDAPNYPEAWLTDALEPIDPPEQRLYFDRKTGTHELKLVRPWYAEFCPFPDILCGCRNQPGSTKIGTYYANGEYAAREGFEEIEPQISPA